MKKFLPALVLANLLVVPLVSLAAEIEPIPEAPIETQEDLIDLIERIGNIIFTALLAVAAIFLIVAGFMFVTAGGNPEAVNKARQMLINALIGIAVALGTKGLIAVIRNIIGV